MLCCVVRTVRTVRAGWILVASVSASIFDLFVFVLPFAFATAAAVSPPRTIIIAHADTPPHCALAACFNFAFRIFVFRDRAACAAAVFSIFCVLFLCLLSMILRRASRST